MCDGVQAVTQISSVQVVCDLPHCGRADGGEGSNDKLSRKSGQLHSCEAFARL